MCGILGCIPEYGSHTRFRAALERLAHRGPDGDGILHAPEHQFSFGHKRLKIIDLDDRSNQPFVYGPLTIVFNGEIYNYLELKEQLSQKGYQFRTSSDTEVICAAFDAWGEACLSRFNGMWAFAIWDERKKVLFLARDRFGQKPLFYSFSDSRFLFASEMKALMALQDDNGLAASIHEDLKDTLIYETQRQTLIKGICRFPKGSFAFVRSGDTSVTPASFWETAEHLESVPKTYDDQVSRFKELFKNACELRLRSDVKLATGLSGGMDSSAVYAQIQEIMDGKGEGYQSFTAGFEGSSIDETHHAQAVAQHFGQETDIIPVSGKDSVDKLPEHMRVFEEIFITAPSPMMELYKNIKAKGITVCLDGHGADEMLCGYGEEPLNGLFASFPSSEAVHNLLRAYNNVKGEEWNGAGMISATQKVMEQGHKLNMGWLGSLKQILIEHTQKDPRETFYKGRLYTIFHETTLPTLLRNYDHYSMYGSVESRMPFMDHRVVSYIFSLPVSSLFKLGFTKSPVRSAFVDRLPREVVFRKDKIGFNSPFHEWMKSPSWKNFILDHIRSESFLSNPLFDGPKESAILEKSLEDDSSGKPVFMDGMNTWTRLSPYFWYEFFYKSMR